MPEEQTIEADEVGALDAALLTEAPRPETALESLQRLQTFLDNAKATAKAKADAVEERIAAVGGEPSAAVREALEKLRDSL